jgi:transposase
MKAYSLDLRQKIVDIYTEGKISQRRLAKQFKVAPSFIEKLLRRQREHGTIEPKIRTEQTPTKLNLDQMMVLEKIVADNNDATLDELRKELYQKTGVSISRSTVDRMLSKLNLTLKKKTTHPTEKELDRVQQERMEFWRLVEGILAKDLIFIDESGINLAFTRLRARSQKGQRARGKRPQKRGKNVSLIGAIGLDGLVTQISLMGATDGLTFEAFISQKLVPKLWPGACVLMDNCSIHKRKEIEELITKAGARLIYLPPYSPDFSPIENCWSKIKNVLRSIEARNYPDLIKAVETAFNFVSLKNIKSWFTHCCYCTSLD